MPTKKNLTAELPNDKTLIEGYALGVAVDKTGDTMTGNLEVPSVSIGGDFVSTHSFKNKLINPNFTIWQEGISFTGAGDKYTAEGWIYYDGVGDNSLVTRSSIAHPTSNYGLRINCSVAGATSYALAQFIEDSKSLSGKTVTFSIDLVAIGVSTQAKLKVVKQLKTNPLINGYDNFIVINETTVTVGTSWGTRQSVTANIPSSTADDYYYGVVVEYLTPSVNDKLYLTEAQLEIGSNVTPLEHIHPQLELARCQRYFEKSYDLETVAGTITNVGGLYSMDNSTAVTSVIGRDVVFKVSKRVAPSVIVYSTNNGVAGNIFEERGNTNRGAFVRTVGINGFEPAWTSAPSTSTHILARWHFTANARLL